MRQRIYNRQALKGARQVLRGDATRAERLLWAYLRKRQLDGFRFRRQHSAGPYVLDFYCPEARLVVELDGTAHDAPEARAYDTARDAYLCRLGLTVLRFRNEDVFHRLHAVLAHIRHYLQKSPPQLRGTVSKANEGVSPVTPPSSGTAR